MVFSQAIQAEQQEHQSKMDNLNKMAEQVYQKAPPEISQRYHFEMDSMMACWRHMCEQLRENVQKLQEHMTKLQQFQVGVCLVYITLSNQSLLGSLFQGLLSTFINYKMVCLRMNIVITDDIN